MQLKQPLTWVNAHEEDDLINQNYRTPSNSLAQQDGDLQWKQHNFQHDNLPYNQQTFHKDRYGLVRPPPDRQYEWPAQSKHPINLENRHTEDDIEFKYNPNK